MRSDAKRTAARWLLSLNIMSAIGVGSVIAGKYLLMHVLGTGACGVVYRAKQLSLDKEVAVKILHRAMSHDASIVARFHREARAASQLDHPSSIAVFDFGQDEDGLLYLVMEYIEGRDLVSVMTKEAPLSTERIVDLLGQVLAALAVAHDQGIIHRDLKPENILIVRATDDDGEEHELVKVVDFGIAALADAKASRLTAAGLCVGTPEYMSPEHAKGEIVDGRSDLYALGTVLYELLTGRVPFQGETPVATLLQHMTAPVKAPSELNPSVDPILERVCLRALRKDRSARWSHARQMRAALREALAPPLPSIDVELPPEVSPRSYSTMVAIAAACALVIAALVVRATSHENHALGESVTSTSAVSDRSGD